MYTPSQTFSPYSYSMNSVNYGNYAQQNNGIIWVQGEAGAKSFIVNPGQTVLLMDSENNVFYIKSSDSSGMPMPLRTFDYKERAVQNPVNDQTKYITREEFEKRLAEVSNGKQFVPANKSK